MGSPYASARNGLWDASDVDTWGQGLGVYPQTAGDVVNIGHTVTYNKVSTAELGAITINNGGLLTFSTAMSTKLTLGHVDITVNNGGELRAGANGAVIPSTRTAELVWNTTADNAKGLNIASGGKLTINGDPTFYGSKYDYILATQVVVPAATNAVTITVTGNYAGNFVAGQELVIHKGGACVSTINDFARLAVVSAANNEANTDISCTVTERPAALTCLVGADVMNVSRNVLLYKLGYNANIGQTNANRPRLANPAVSGNVNMAAAVFGGWYSPVAGSFSCNNLVLRNGYFGVMQAINSTVNAIIFSCYWSNRENINCDMSVIILASQYYACYGNKFCRITGKTYGSYGVGSGYNFGSTFKDYYIYSCTSALRFITGETFINGAIGFNPEGLEMANGTFWTLDNGYQNATLINTKTPAVITTSGRNGSQFGRLKFEHYQQVANSQYIMDAFGDLLKVLANGSGSLPSQRSGGSQYVEQVTPQSNCSSNNYLEIFNVRVWATAGVAKTYRFYIQNNFGKTLTDAMLKLYADYPDNNPAGTGHIATVGSTGQSVANRISQADWSQGLSVTITPQADGWVNLYLRLTDGTNASLWVDPMPVVS